MDTSTNEQQKQAEVLALQNQITGLPSITALCLRQLCKKRSRLVAADSSGVHFSRQRTLLSLLCIVPLLKKQLARVPNVGLCLPSSAAAVIASLAIWMRGKTLVPLNYTASVENIKAAIDAADVQQIVSSRRFLKRLKERGINLEDAFADSEVIYLEDMKRQSKNWKLPFRLTMSWLAPGLFFKWIFNTDKTQPAVVLFSTGSEGKPKGIVLSQDNVIGNAKQAADAMQAKNNDVMVATLPVFHVFGLTATTLLPLIEGIPMVCHPDPRDGVAIGHLVHQWKGTILCGTSTFFRLYVRSKMLKPELFSSLRLVVAGAEKLLPQVRHSFKEKFGHEIYEGYGASELSPVCAVNRPNWGEHVRFKSGTVGQSLLGCWIRVIDPETHQPLPTEKAGMIAVAGVNVMQGYLNDPVKTAEVVFEADGLRWYKTGDKGVLDKAGFLTILDRYSRFAKLAGEMVSLAAIESQVRQIISRADIEILAIALPDIAKGEKVVLLYSGNIEESDLRSTVNRSAMHNLYKPNSYRQVNEIPKFASGKTDFAAAKQLL